MRQLIVLAFAGFCGVFFPFSVTWAEHPLALDMSQVGRFQLLPAGYQPISISELKKFGRQPSGTTFKLQSQDKLAVRPYAALRLNSHKRYWGNFDFDFFSVWYRDQPLGLLSEKSIPASLQAKLLKADNFAYGTKSKASGDNFSNKLEVLVERKVILPQVMQVFNSFDSYENFVPSRGPALLAARSDLIGDLSDAYYCSDELLLAKAEIIDLLAGILAFELPNKIYGRFDEGFKIEAASALSYEFEQISGLRALSPVQLDDLLANNIGNNIGKAKPGLVLDIAADPRCVKGCHYEQDEYAVFSYTIAEQVMELAVDDLPYYLILRYAPLLARVYATDATAKKLEQGFKQAKAAVKILEQQYASYLRVEDVEKNRQLELYEQAQVHYRRVLDKEILEPVTQLWKLIQSAGRSERWKVLIKAFYLQLAGQRETMMELTPEFIEREYVALSLQYDNQHENQQDIQQGAWTWLPNLLDYPPDYAYVPKLQQPVVEQINKLLVYLSGCQRFDL